MMKITLKYSAALLGIFVSSSAFAQTCETDCFVVIEPTELSNVACGSTPQVFSYTLVNQIGQPIPIEALKILIDEDDSWANNSDLVTIQEPETNDDCHEGGTFTSSCKINVSINPQELGYCPPGGLKGRIDRTLHVDLDSPQPSANAPVETHVTPKGSLNKWSYLGPNVINYSDAPAQANKNVGQTEEQGSIINVNVQSMRYDLYDWFEPETISALANLEAVFASYYEYIYNSTPIHSSLGSYGHVHELAASYYRFYSHSWPVTLHGTLKINGGEDEEAVFVLDFDESTSENIIFSVYRHAKIELHGGIKPENVIFVLNDGSMATDGACTLVGTYLIDGGFSDQPDHSTAPCYINGSVFSLLQDEDVASDEVLAYDPPAFKTTNINLHGTTINTPYRP